MSLGMRARANVMIDLEDHYHCPERCEHPQPFVGPDGDLLCGRCWAIDRTATLMELCEEGRGQC